ncbi:MAG TPA: SCO family protein [Herpetosiphonaceae bacterium]
MALSPSLSASLWRRCRSLGRVLLGAVLLGACQAAAPAQLQGRPLEPASPAPALVLTDHRGTPFTLADQRGKVVLLFFGYASCPDICSTVLADLASVRQQLGPDAEQLQVLFVTVDPDRDTPAALARYVAAFDPTFLGLRGTPEELTAVYQSYGVAVPAEHTSHAGADAPEMLHGQAIYVIDPAGRWRALVSAGDPISILIHDVRALLQEG